jgi:hypothetical protein
MEHHTSSARAPVQTLSVTCSAVPNCHQTNLNFPRNMISQTSQIAVAFSPLGDRLIAICTLFSNGKYSDFLINPRECLTV